MTNSGSQPYSGSVKARVYMRSPEAMAGRRDCFCSSLPASRMALAERTAEERWGLGQAK